ncbi:DUF2807 domain-containing protein [Mucilaginibacter sp. 14171R-50]|uniref:head GIN domain-containing protein n=1 Tax=Mucilaginibacter sp. 14171R-50 TaxID=2703789 RepID=UPI00138DA324|nr:head GIN domain-containing protein [Mucilaginibacter sp. 14171R-50]QHS54334.1 DUF2807 domain-containing protein [Mucilaginibacter sp. 14171R-50]
MKKAISCFVLVICAVITFSAAAQEVTRDVSGFTGIECNGPFNVQIKIDGTESLKLDVDAEVLNDIKTVVEDGVLKIGLKNGWKNHSNVKRANVYITAKKLSYLANGGSGNAVLTGVITGENATLAVSGSGNLKAGVKSTVFRASVSGSGSIDLNGSTGSAAVSVSGSGSINAKEFTAQTVNAKISGSGGVSIIANISVSASISGSGGLEYTGNAKIANSNYSGSGRITKVN